MGLVGGSVGYTLLTWIAPREDAAAGLSGSAYRNKSKLEALLGREFFADIQGKTVLDFGCGGGEEAIEMAQRGAGRVIGVDIRRSLLNRARARAAEAGVADRCAFTTTPEERADIVVSLDSFEHFDDPTGILRAMDTCLMPDGKVVVSFGPPWYHPRGGHLFSVFPWAHLIFTERALLLWRKRFRARQTAKSITECGLNKMTVSRFERLIAGSSFRFERYKIRPVHGHDWLTSRVVREFGTSVVTCTLVKRARVSSPAAASACRPFPRRTARRATASDSST